MGLRNILSPLNQQQTSQSRTLGGGVLSLFEPGTTTFITAFGDSSLVTPLTQPIRLSGSGRSDVWINRDCDLQLTDRNGNLILFQENANPDALGAGASGGLIANGSFEEDTDIDGVPDSWVATNEAGSTNARDTSESTDGVASYRFTSSGLGGGTLTTENFFPVNDADDLRVEFDLRSTVAAVRNIIRVEWYDVSQISISDSDVYDSTANPTAFTSFGFAASPPALARFAKLKLIGIDPSVLLAGSTYFDRVAAFYPAVVSGIFDNIEIVNNSILTTNTNGDLFLTPNGTGAVNIAGTATDPADLVDTKNPLNVGALDPTANPHIAMDLNRIQAKTDATNAGDLNLNPFGGNLNIGSVLTPGDTVVQIIATTAADPRLLFGQGAGALGIIEYLDVGDIFSIESDGDIILATANTAAISISAAQQVSLAASLYLAEVAAGSNVSNFGQLFVDTNNDLIYRDEGGTDTNLLEGGSVTTVGTIQDMAGVANRAGSLVTGTKWFKIYIYDLNMDGNGERPTLRLSDGGGLQTTGYSSKTWDKSNQSTYQQTTHFTQTTWFDPNGLSNLGIATGYWEGILIEESSNTWAVHGHFRDDFNLDHNWIDVLGEVALDSEATGWTIASGNASTWAAGSLSFQSHT